MATTIRLRKTLWLIVVYDFKSRYRAQSLGMFWSIANPVVMMAILTIAFTQILSVPIPNFPIFYLVVGIQWHFFVGSLMGSMGSLVGRADIVKRTSLPRYFAPLIGILSNLINLGMEALVVLGFYFVFPSAYQFGPSLLFLPILLVLLVLLCVALGLIVSSTYVRFRDTEYLVSAIVQLGFWVSPILYSTDMAPPWVATLLRLNPLAGLFEASRGIVMHDRVPELWQIVPSVVSVIVLFVVGCLVFRKSNLTVADYI